MDINLETFYRTDAERLNECSPVFWAGPNVIIQRDGQSLSHILKQCCKPIPDLQTPANIWHGVNFFPDRDNPAVQNETALSMVLAAENCQSPVRLLQIPQAHVADVTPPGFERTAPFERDIRTVSKGLISRPLPLLFDVLSAGFSSIPSNDYVVYSNTDICLRPAFYSVVVNLLDQGFDALVINRRTVEERYLTCPDPERLKTDHGTQHGGYDCFVFKRSLLDDFVRNDSCLGIAGVSMGLLYNMVAVASKMLIVTDSSLTYHFGNDRPWLDKKYAAVTEHNKTAYLFTLEHLCKNALFAERLDAFLQNWRAPAPARDIRGLDALRLK